MKHQRPALWPDTIGPGRFASRIRRDSPDGCRVGLLGMPDDLGVRLNHGRPGAGVGPYGFRSALLGYGASEPSGFEWPGVYDAGDVQPDPDDLDTTHARVTAAARQLHEHGLLPVGIGGGHDLTFPFVRAAAEHAGESMTAIYLDAHLDVRAEPGSGMPFRALVEGGHCHALYVQGLDAYANTREHTAWFRAHGGRINALRHEDDWPEGPLFVSLDLDVIDQAYAPGVSATNPCGWSPKLAAKWCRAAGRCPRVRCFDIMELSPPHDPTNRTARLAARLFLEFLRGVAERKG